MDPKNYQRILSTAFSNIYPMYVAKAKKKDRSQEEVNQIICWLTGYNEQQLKDHLNANTNFQDFFSFAPQIHPNTSKITGVICGYRVEEIEDPLMQKFRYLDKLIDELAKGKSMDKILRK